MFSGYEDVAAYYMEENGTGSEDGGRQPLPLEYLPRFLEPDPWHKTSHCPEDFVMIAEFSEQEGPKPLLTIPDDLSSRMDLNDFSVKIMSVDFQTVASEKFSVSEDTQVVISQSHQGVYAYIHHFTLYDHKARGFVRPFCMAYVTPDSRKVMSLYEDLQREFTAAASYFHYGNLELFVQDMTHYLSDLHFTQSRFQEQIERTENEVKDLENGQANETSDLSTSVNGSGHKRVSSLGAEEQLVLKTVTQEGLQKSITEVKNILDITSKMLNDDTELKMKFEKLKLKSQGAVVSPEQETLKFDKFHFTSSSLREESPLDDSLQAAQKSGSWSDLTSSSEKRQMEFEVYRPRLVRTSKKRFDKALRSLDQLCPVGADEGKKRLTNLYKYFSRDMATLMIERRDQEMIEPSHSLLTIGKNVQLNFLSGLKFNGLPTLGMKNSESVFSGRWDDTASFQSAESFLSCQDDVAYDEGASMASYDVISADDTSLDYSLLNETDQYNNLCNPELRLTNLSKSPPQATPGSSSSVPPSLGTRASLSRVQVFSTMDHLHAMGPGLPGYGLLRLVQKYPFSPHLLYALLCGRLVAIVGTSAPESERSVRQMVTALSVLVPGHSSDHQRIIPWQTAPLTMRDLASVKLVGLCSPDSRKTMDQIIPATIRRHISVLDVARRVLVTPGYQGGAVTDVYLRRRSFSTNTAYVAYVHGALLELAAKAFVFYHAFCTDDIMGPPLNRPGGGGFRCSLQREQQQFFTRLKVGADDAQIVQYLAELIVEQQLQEFYPALERSNAKIQLSNRKSGQFKL